MSNLVKDFWDLPGELAEEVLLRVPLTSLRKVRSTCRKWYTLIKDISFAKKQLARQGKQKEGMMVVMKMNFRVSLMRINLNNNNNVEPCIHHEGKLISIDDSISDAIDISQVFHCDGLLLFVTERKFRLVVWNPYHGQTKWIEPYTKYSSEHSLYAFGYEDSHHRSYKILTFYVHFCRGFEHRVYNCNSDSWRDLDVDPDFEIGRCIGGASLKGNGGVSVKGNAYWYSRDRDGLGFLICFDFTKERFGARLPLPGEWHHEYFDPATSVSVSSVREEQLAILFQIWDTSALEIWITTKIEPNAVSWNSKVFIQANMAPLTDFDSDSKIWYTTGRFLVDEEKEVVVVFDKDQDVRHTDDQDYASLVRHIAYIVGEDGSWKEVYLGKSAHTNEYPLVCSYVPSLVQLP